MMEAQAAAHDVNQLIQAKLRTYEQEKLFEGKYSLISFLRPCNGCGFGEFDSNIKFEYKINAMKPSFVVRKNDKESSETKCTLLLQTQTKCIMWRALHLYSICKLRRAIVFKCIAECLNAAAAGCAKFLFSLWGKKAKRTFDIKMNVYWLDAEKNSRLLAKLRLK